jgi:hypothetical protein
MQLEVKKKVVIAALDVVGFHGWPSAPAVVGYLADMHRHVFKVRVECTVTDPDRQVEFHMLKRRAFKLLCELYLPESADHLELMLGARSCEQIALDLCAAFKMDTAGPWPISAIEVWEDAENGARVEFG